MGVPLLVESCIWYGITLMVVAARIASRKVLLGSFKKFQVDDFLMILALVADTVLLVVINIASEKNTNLIDPEHVPLLTPEDITDRILGSKLTMVSEQSQILIIWLVKACLLIMYSRLTFGKIQRLCIKLVAGYVAFGFVLMEIFYFGVWCRPFDQYWAIPANSIQCTAEPHHLITNAVLNISSDLFIISIPVPVFLHINIATRKKVVLCAVFALGIFTIGAAIANKYYSFTQPYSAEWTYWYIRESSTALIVANIPFVWTTLVFCLRMPPFTNSRSGRNNSNNTPGAPIGSAYGHNARSVNHNTTISRGTHSVDFTGDFHPLDSHEDHKYYGDNIPLKIFKRQEVLVTTSQGADGSEASGAASQASHSSPPGSSGDRVSLKI
ncbi:hypothetical protein F5Y14DRAFT_195153 [Nemania sp. NC0429]|nr:hypothetical protein F5Y14DRAFT_195153 [Nemania sp. NC0429]